MKKIILLSWIIYTSAFCGEFKVAVAANVSYAMEDLTQAFNALYPDTKVQITLGSSGKLTAQITNGAPYDLFMAANMMYPETLYEKGIAVTKPIVYAKGSLAYLSKNETDFSKGIKILEDASIKKIAIANPKTAPYGKAAVEAMKKGGIYEKAKDKLVYAESISQTVTYAMTASDIGFVAKSSLYSSKMKHFKEGVHWSEVDTQLYTPIDQGVVILKRAQENAEVKAFYDFLLSSEGKKILSSYGYIVR